MGNQAARLALPAILLLLLSAVHIANAQSDANSAEVRQLILNTASLIDQIDAQISSLHGMASQIGSCPCSGEDPCADASATADLILSDLSSKNQNAKALVVSAVNDYGDSNIPLSKAVKDIGDALQIIQGGLRTADAESGRIPSSCPDDTGTDVCPMAKQAVSSAIASVYGNYQSVKSQYDRLASTPAAQQTPQPTTEQAQDTAKNDRLLTVYPKLGEAQRMRDTINNMAQSGASESDLSSARMQLNGLEKQAEDVYSSVLLDHRYKNDFWTNWDYATLKKNQGDVEAARQLYATALSSTNVDPKAKQEFMDKLKTDSQQELGLQAQPKADDKVVKSISGSLHEKYDSVKQAGSSAFSDFKSGFVFSLAKVGKVINDMQDFEDAITGKKLEKAAQQSGN